jgi:para-nitrobenzyl esterase
MSEFVTIETSTGRVRGLTAHGVRSFKGIPYAAAPVGVRRFRPPEPVEPWAIVRDAFQYGARSLQYENAFPVPPEVREMVTSYQPVEASEDCLFLNVWMPATGGAPTLPVMIWLHGGAFTSGCGAQPWTDGSNLCRSGVVVVSLNHRLGALGFLHLEDIAGPKFAGSGLAGMLDIVAALEWVRDNIAAFGGDPSNVTIFGESGGGAKVSVLMAMPSARGLFHRAIIQSGPAVEVARREDGTATALQVLQELGLKAADAHRLASASADTLLGAQIAVIQKISLASFAERRRRGFNPVIGQTGLPSGPFAPEAPAISDHIPLMIGTNKDELTLFYTFTPWFQDLDETGLRDRVRVLVGDKADKVLDGYRRARPHKRPQEVFLAIAGDQGVRLPSLLMADRKVARGAAPVFVYLFAHETQVLGGQLRSVHTLEVPYVFNQLDAAPIVGERSPNARKLAEAMTATWVAFARTGSPNNTMIPDWPAYSEPSRPTMVFDFDCRVELDPDRIERLAWHP